MPNKTFGSWVNGFMGSGFMGSGFMRFMGFMGSDSTVHGVRLHTVHGVRFMGSDSTVPIRPLHAY